MCCLDVKENYVTTGSFGERPSKVMFVCGLDDGNLSLSDPESAASSECLPEPEPGGWRLVGSLCFVT